MDMIQVSVRCDGCKIGGRGGFGPDFNDFLVGADDKPVSVAIYTSFDPRDVFNGKPVSLILYGKGFSGTDIVEEDVAG